ncbi:MAG: bifunctional N-acetylglucosamine-1-phosphate uridyltransferase/glucosamine-1-phosphate acetyltransferase [Microthrixaceae bacterium]
MTDTTKRTRARSGVAASGAPGLSAVLLAAGQGSRMRSERPKPLHRLCGSPMLSYVLDSLSSSGVDRAVIVVGHKGEWVTKKMSEESPGVPLDFVEQRVQRGTGDATMVGLVGLPEDDDGDVLVMPGDTPLLRSVTVEALVAHHRSSGAAATLLTSLIDDPTGYGRIIRSPADKVTAVVEEGDATEDQRAIHEVNTSIYCFRRSLLAPALRRVQPDNSQGEYYLTDVVGVLVDAGHTVEAIQAPEGETQGVNDRAQLAAAEAELRRRTNHDLLGAGVTMVDPSATYVDTTVTLGRDVSLFPGVILQGSTVVGDGTEVGPGCRLVDTTVGSDCVLTHVVAERAVIGDRATVGPFASIPAGSEVASDTTTGAFYTPDPEAGRT